LGTLRTLFAITVVFAHSFGDIFVGGRNAVQLFYIISGFLISYVLVERRTYSNIVSFYINRYLRLYPIYFIVAVITLLAFTITNFYLGKNLPFFKVYQNAPFTANALLVFSNISLFLQDWVMFAGVENNHLVFSTDFAKSEIVLHQALLVPQAWTLGVELSFYLLAPFVLNKRRVLLTLLALSISLRMYLIYIGLGRNDPWTYRFFPTELALFLLGALSHQLLLPLYRKVLSREKIEEYTNFSTFSFIFITLVFWIIPIHELLKTIVLFTLFLISMPLTFIFQSKREWDKWIGNLSYPIYICHLLVIHVTEFVFGKFGIANTVLISIAAVVFSISFSIILNIYVGNPIESLRNRYREKS